MIGPLDRGIYLASRSPRRRELLSQIGVRYHLLLFRSRPDSPPDVDESVLANEQPDAYVERVARAKVQAGWRLLRLRNLPFAPVLAADTTVSLDGQILGKPADRKEAAEMLAALSGRRHDVFTAVALMRDERIDSAVSRSEVQFKQLSPEDIAQYIATGECDDKAGAYAIQGRAARFIMELRGSYSGVMGLPLFETGQLLDKLRDRRNSY
ncbi:MAG TPA: Maf family protein [Burkholderiales bacterium]|jgi:septum formation protein